MSKFQVGAGVDQVHQKNGRAVQVQEMALGNYFVGDESETLPYSAVKDRKSESYQSTYLDRRTSGYALAFLVGAEKELGHKKVLLKTDSDPEVEG